MSLFSFVKQFLRPITPTTPVIIPPPPPPTGHRAIGFQDAGFKRATTSDLYRDKFSQSEWRGNTGSSPPQYPISADGLLGTQDHTGTINQFISGDAAARLLQKQFWAVLGDYDIIFPLGFTLSVNLPGTKTFSAATTVGVSVGYQKVVMTIAEHNDGKTTELVFTATTATVPYNLAPTIIKSGDTDTDWIASRAVVATHLILGTNCHRTMDMRNVNSDMTLYDYPRVYRTSGPSIDFFVDLCNRTNADLWLNMSFYMTDSAIQAEILYAIQHLNSNLRVFIEWSNEVWNTQFGQWEESCIMGILAGFDSSITASGAVAFQRTATHRAVDGVHTIKGSPDVNGVPSIDFAIGESVVGNVPGIGVGFFTARVAISANDTAAAVPKATNAYWTVNVTGSLGNRAGARYYSDRLRAIVRLGRDAVFSEGLDPTRVIGTVCWQTTSSIITGSTGSLRDIAEFSSNNTTPNSVETYRGAYVFGCYATAPYWGGGQGGFKLGPYSTNHVGTWNAANKALYTTNRAATVNAYFDPSVAPAAMKATTDIFVKRVTELGDYAVSKGLPRNAWLHGAYEFGPHNDILDYTNATKAGDWNDVTAANLLVTDIQYDQRTADLVANQYLPAILAVATGPCCWYARYGKYPWNVQLDELDHGSANDPLFLALCVGH